VVAAVKEQMKWMILGGDGQLGRTMALELSRSGAEFISLNRAQLDITNQNNIHAWLAKEQPDVVVNAAGWTNVDLAETEKEKAQLVNTYGPRFLATACAEISAKFVQISTDYVFSGNAGSPWQENAKRSPVSAYGRTKAAGEEFVLDIYPNGSYIVRTAWLYSPWNKNFVRTMLKVALEEIRNVEVVCDQVGQPTSANDLAVQIHKMINHKTTPGIYHGTNSGQASWFDLAQRIFTLVGADPSRVIAVDSSRFPRPAKRPKYSVLGHDHWLDEGLVPMRSWQIALADALPTIIQAVKQGE
jgi:dTDP-4-dehydrorhamnose reductase